MLNRMKGIVERMAELASESEWKLLREMVLADLLEGGSHINARDAEGFGVLHTVCGLMEMTLQRWCGCCWLPGLTRIWPMPKG